MVSNVHMPATTTETTEKPKLLKIGIPEGLHRRLKVRAASEGKFIHDLAAELLEEALREKDLQLVGEATA